LEKQKTFLTNEKNSLKNIVTEQAKNILILEKKIQQLTKENSELSKKQTQPVELIEKTFLKKIVTDEENIKINCINLSNKINFNNINLETPINAWNDKTTLANKIKNKKQEEINNRKDHSKSETLTNILLKTKYTIKYAFVEKETNNIHYKFNGLKTTSNSSNIKKNNK